MQFVLELGASQELQLELQQAWELQYNSGIASWEAIPSNTIGHNPGQNQQQAQSILCNLQHATTTIMSDCVWVKLYILGEDKPEGSPFEIKPIPENVNGLRRAVKTNLQPGIDHASLDEIFVYPPGITVTAVGADGKPLDPWVNVPSNSSGPNPLIAVAVVAVGDSSHRARVSVTKVTK